MEDEEEDDLLVGESGRATGEMDQDEEEEYDMEDDEEEADEAADEPTEEAVEPPKEVERASPAKASGKQKEKVPPKEEAAKKQSGPAKEAYVLRNGVAYQVPMSLDHKGPGRVRDYGNYIVVENDEVLGQMNLAKNWPKPADFPSTAIIVIKAKHQESDVLEATDLKGPFEWYARVVTKDDVEGRRTSSNSKIMKPLPSQLVQGLIKYLVNHKVFCVSSLITKYQPDSESKKPFPVDINGWEKVTGVKSTGTGPKKDAKPAKEPKEPAKSPPPPVDDNDLDDDLESEERVEQGSPSVKQPSKAKAAAPAPSPSDKKRSMSTSVAQLSLEAKKPVKKGGMLNFAKPTKPHAEGAASSSVGVPLPVAAKSPAPKPVEQPAPEKKAPEKPAEKPADKPVDKPAKPLRLAAASPAAASPAAASSSGQKRLLSTSDAEETAFKRVRKVDVDNASTTITFWKDNTLFIAEL